ncbi:MAG: HAD family phosphatase [Lachnospiraceae bacterium]|nr:HAD family phosphatase [Lachnospiraceae bacterium]
MIKNIIFDIGNVLVEFGWERFLKRFSDNPEEFDRLVKATVGNPDWAEMDRGVLSDEEILDLFIENDPELEPKLRTMYKDYNGLLVQFGYAKEWIDDLKKRGYKVYALSNMSYKAIRECADSMDFLSMMDGSILSCYYKLIKPDPNIYRLLFDTFDLIPQECVFFDDLEKNIEAARASGMSGVVFKNKEQAEAELAKLL